MDWAKHGVKIAHSDELDLNTPQTSGMTRAAAITHAKAGASKLWPAQWWFNRIRLSRFASCFSFIARGKREFSSVRHRMAAKILAVET